MADSADRAQGIGWLHLSDLLISRRGSAIAGPEVRSLLDQDIRRLHDVCGPWDFVAITGNLSFTGSPAELERAALVLKALWSTLHDLGPEPALIMVPGHHDAARVPGPSPVGCSPMVFGCGCGCGSAR